MMHVLQSVISAVEHAVMVTDEDQNVLAANSAAAALHGVPRDTDPSRWIAELRSRCELTDDAGRPVEVGNGPLSRAIAGERIRNLELGLKDRKTGIRRVLRYSASRVELGGPIERPVFVVTIEDVTAPRRAEQARSETEQRLQLALESIRFGMYEYDVGRDEVVCSTEAYRQFGLSRGTPLRFETLLGAIHPGDRVRVQQLTDAAFRGEDEGRYAAECRVIGLEDGVERWLSAWGRVVHDHNRKPVWMFGIALDVTERVGAERALRASRLRFRALAENAPDPIALYDRALRYLYANRATAEVAGIPVERFVGRTHADLGFPREKVKRWDALLRRTFESGVAGTHEFELAGPGGVRFFESQLVPELNTEGRVESVLVISRDVTTRVEQGRQLREAEERFRTLAENSPDPIIRYDRDLRALYFNPEFQRITGLSREEREGRTIFEVGYPPDFVATWSAEIKKVFARGTPHTAELRYDGREGLRFLECNLVPECRDGDVQTVLVVARDVTERVRYEEELRASREDLRRLAARVDAVREEEQGRIARDLHDEMGQSLTALKMELAGLEATVDAVCGDARAAPILERAVAASELANRALREVRKIISGLRPGALSELGLEEALQGCVRGFTETCGVSCELSFSPKVPLLSPEVSTAIYRIVQEALTNVTRHARARRACVAIELVNTSLEVRVEDDGCGIQAASGGGLGIVGMRERAARLGGIVCVEPRASGGTVALARIPI